MATTSSIGSKEFAFLHGEAGIYQEMVEILRLPFSDGETLRSSGFHSEPFRLQSRVDIDGDLADARNELEDYKDLVAAGAQKLVWNGVDFDTLTNPAKVEVLDVRPVRIATVHGITGGLNVAAGQAGTLLWCDWTLILRPA